MPGRNYIDLITIKIITATKIFIECLLMPGNCYMFHVSFQLHKNPRK